MEETKSTKKNWIYFTIWLAIIVFLLANPSSRPFFWLALPGVCTHFAKAMNLLDPNTKS
jgi:hypothetical protein